MVEWKQRCKREWRAKEKSGSASLLKQLKVWMRFTKSSTAKQGPNVAVKGRLSESRPNQKQTHYDNKPNHTHTHTGKSTLYILKLGREGKKACGNIKL